MSGRGKHIFRKCEEDPKKVDRRVRHEAEPGRGGMTEPENLSQ